MALGSIKYYCIVKFSLLSKLSLEVYTPTILFGVLKVYFYITFHQLQSGLIEVLQASCDLFLTINSIKLYFEIKPRQLSRTTEAPIKASLLRQVR